MTKEYVLVVDKQDNVLAVPVPKNMDVGVYRDKIEERLGIETRGIAAHTSWTELAVLARNGEV